MPQASWIEHCPGWLVVAAVVFVMADRPALSGQAAEGWWAWERRAPDSRDAKISAGTQGKRSSGTEKTLSLTRETDGYFANQAIKILMPEKLRSFETVLLAVG